MAETAKRVVTVGVATPDDVRQRLSRAVGGEAAGSHISFPTIDLMWRVLAPKRWEILAAMAGQGPLAVREVARRVNRDVKAVHGDVKALQLVRIVHKTEDRKVEFPYDEIHIDVVIRPGVEAA
jgi:predicted transcriptional regulator